MFPVSDCFNDLTCASFYVAAWLSSLPCNEHEKKVTVLPSWLRVAFNATSDASVSTLKGMSSSMAVTKDFSAIFLRSSYIPTASDGSRKDLWTVVSSSTITPDTGWVILNDVVLVDHVEDEVAPDLDERLLPQSHIRSGKASSCVNLLIVCEYSMASLFLRLSSLVTIAWAL